MVSIIRNYMRDSFPTFVVSLCLLIFAITASPALAQQQASTTMNVSSNAVAYCSVSAFDLTFPDFSGPEVTSTSSVTVNCTIESNYAISLGPGIHGNSSTGRRMSDGTGHYLNYDLYSDSGNSAVWGDDYAGEYTFNGAASVYDIGIGSDQVKTVYGKMFSQTVQAVGLYTDTIDVTVHY